MAQNVFTYVYDDSFIDQRILQLAHEIHGQCARQTSHMKEKMLFQFIIYNDSIAVLVTNHTDVSTFIIDTFTDYELILDFVDRVPCDNAEYKY